MVNFMVEVKIESITKSFGDFVAVHDSSLEVQSGEILTLLGPSGSGKSTILRMIAGLIFPDSGKIYFGEKDVTNLPPQKRNTAMVFQNYALFPHMSVKKNVEYGLNLRKVNKEEKSKRVKEVLDKVQMTKFIDWMPNKLSGGQQQRIAVARALVVNPDILLLDEPLSNLDAKLRVETRQEIRDLVKDLNLTSIFVTHDQIEALSISDKIAVMEIGYIRQVGLPKDIWNFPETSFVGSFIGDANTLEMEVKNVDREFAELLIPGTGKTIKSSYIQDVKQNEKAKVIIRPDSFQIKFDVDSNTNAFPCEIRSVMFFGTFQHIIARLPDNQTELVIYDDDQVKVERGQQVFLEVNPKQIKSFGSSKY